MRLQKYRADKQGDAMKNGSVPWYTEWAGGSTLALVRNCPIIIQIGSGEGPFETRASEKPRTVYITGEADTFFTIPAVCKWKSYRVKGYITYSEDDGGYVFHGHIEG